MKRNIWTSPDRLAKWLTAAPFLSLPLGLVFAWAGQPVVAAVIVIAIISTLALAVVIIGLVIVAAAEPTPSLSSRSLLVARLAWIWKTLAGVALLIAGGFIGALIAVELAGFETLPDNLAMDRLSTSLASWLKLGTLAIVFFVIYAFPLRISLDLLIMRRVGRRKSLYRVVGVNEKNVSNAHPAKEAWVEHLSGLSYVGLFWLCFIFAASFLAAGVFSALDL